MHPTTVTMMISVFRGPRVPPFGSVCRLLTVVAISMDGSSSSFWNFRTDDYHTLTFFPAFLSIPLWGRCRFASRSLTNAFLAEKKTFSFHLYFCCLLSKDTGPRKRFNNFHSIFPFRAPLTEMTRLLLVGCFKCTQFNLYFRFTFLLQSRSLLRFGHQLLHNPRSMENRVNFFFTLWSHSCASFDLPWPLRFSSIYSPSSTECACLLRKRFLLFSFQLICKVGRKSLL